MEGKMFEHSLQLHLKKDLILHKTDIISRNLIPKNNREKESSYDEWTYSTKNLKGINKVWTIRSGLCLRYFFTHGGSKWLGELIRWKSPSRGEKPFPDFTFFNLLLANTLFFLNDRKSLPTLGTTSRFEPHTAALWLGNGRVQLLARRCSIQRNWMRDFPTNQKQLDMFWLFSTSTSKSEQKMNDVSGFKKVAYIACKILCVQ